MKICENEYSAPEAPKSTPEPPQTTPGGSKINPRGSKIDPGGSKIDPGGSQIDPVSSGGSQVVPESVPVTFWGALGDPFGTQNGAQKHQNLLKIEPNSKKRENFNKTTKKVKFVKNAIPPMK